jgi:ammonia channel protein AmtB
MVFVATAASIVSGALAERINLWLFLGFVVVLSAVIYPIQGSWQWGGGWLAEAGFSDFAGSTLVHSVGGWAALIGAVGGAIVIFGTPLLYRFKIDDVVSAVPVPLFAGVWGTHAVPLSYLSNSRFKN